MKLDSGDMIHHRRVPCLFTHSAGSAAPESISSSNECSSVFASGLSRVVIARFSGLGAFVLVVAVQVEIERKT
jgi:hypothetical protein